MKKFLYNPWTIGIGTTLLAFFLPIVWDLIKGLEILTTTKEILSFLLNIVLAFLNFEIKAWWLLIAVAVLALALYIAAKIADVKAENQPAFLRYTKDTIQGWCWEWNWQKILLRSMMYIICTRPVHIVVHLSYKAILFMVG